MAEIKWIKIATDIFDDEKILLIESLPDSDAIIICWFKLLCLAGKQNNSGVFMISDKIPYTDKMLATIFRRKESTVQMALKVFEDFGMVEIINGAITIPNWSKHQNFDKLEQYNNYHKEYMRKVRARQKALAEGAGAYNGDVNGDVNRKGESDVIVNAIDKNRIRLEEDKNNTVSNETVYRTATQSDAQRAVDFWNESGLPEIRMCNRRSNRGKMFYSRISEYGIDDVMKAIENAAGSDFLRGQNDRGWVITFDWFVKPNNFLKVLEGNYKNRSSTTPQSQQKSWEEVAAEWEEENG